MSSFFSRRGCPLSFATHRLHPRCVRAPGIPPGASWDGSAAPSTRPVREWRFALRQLKIAPATSHGAVELRWRPAAAGGLAERRVGLRVAEAADEPGLTVSELRRHGAAAPPALGAPSRSRTNEVPMRHCLPPMRLAPARSWNEK